VKGKIRYLPGVIGDGVRLELPAPVTPADDSYPNQGGVFFVSTTSVETGSARLDARLAELRHAIAAPDRSSDREIH
jgi:hypothetical protein